MVNSAFEIRMCTAPDGTRLAWARTGGGPPLLKSANWMTHLELDRHSVLWQHWFDELCVGRGFICYDGRGYGLSDRDPPALELDAMVDDLAAVADAANVERFSLIGFCHGGPIAIAFAARYPERVSALVLSGTYLAGRARRDTSNTDAAERDLLLRLIEVGWGQDSPAFRQVFSSKAIPDASAAVFAAFNELQRVSATPETAVALTRFFWGIDVAALAPAVRCPTLVLHALRDQVVPFEQARSLAASIQGARLVPLDSNNHDLLGHEPAWPVFVAEVQRFLDQHDAPAAAPLTDPLDPLTGRETELLEHLARGLDNAEIAIALQLGEKTVRNHVSRIFAKLGVNSRARAIVLARDHGFGTGRAPPGPVSHSRQRR